MEGNPVDLLAVLPLLAFMVWARRTSKHERDRADATRPGLDVPTSDEGKNMASVHDGQGGKR